MFLDLKGSTSIAEKLPNKIYSALIRDFFYDVSDAILLYKGEVYQYVGDEIIVVWRVRQTNLNCLRSFYKMKEIIESKRETYISRYGLVPEFKAGIHTGKVIVTEVGKQKKEIVFHGDVLNTTSRIEGKCNDLSQELLISDTMLQHLDLKGEFKSQEKGDIELKGKAQKLKLHGILQATNLKSDG